MINKSRQMFTPILVMIWISNRVIQICFEKYLLPYIPAKPSRDTSEYLLLVFNVHFNKRLSTSLLFLIFNLINFAHEPMAYFTQGPICNWISTQCINFDFQFARKNWIQITLCLFHWISNISIDKAPANSNNLLDDILNRDNQGYQLEYNFMINDIIQYWYGIVSYVSC